LVGKAKAITKRTKLSQKGTRGMDLRIITSVIDRNTLSGSMVPIL
jgi:hypothetical protein